MASSGTYTQGTRLISITTPLGEDVLIATNFSGHEGISRLFSYDVDLVSENKSISFKSIVGQPVTVKLYLSDGSTERYFSGYVNRFSQSGTDQRFTHYRMEIVPWLWFLTRHADCRIFQNMTIPDIVTKVFDLNSKNKYKKSLTGSYQPVEYCVQYRETDFNFISRLLEHAGIFYFFEHKEGEHTLVLADSGSAVTSCPVQSTVRYMPQAGQNIEDAVTAWQIEQEYRSGKCSYNDYNFETPSANLFATDPSILQPTDASLELYDYPGLYGVQSDGNGLAKIRMQEEEATYLVGSGASSCRTLASGYLFEMEELELASLNQTYLITEVQHSATAGGSLSSNGDSSYSNHFSCIESKTVYRPDRLTPKPFVQGPQTAMVVGPSGQEIYVDKYGRVKVQFYWDRLGKKNENSSCWIRVSQLWAGQGWGAMFIPRINQEVIVSFLEGDPDRPIITGRVYNAEQTVPYTLPDHDTVSTIQSRSSPHGAAANFNEIRFEDKKGSEQIFVNAEKDMDQRVENDSREYVGNDRHLIINANQYEQVNKDKHLTIQGSHFEQIGKDSSLQIASNSAEKIGSNFDLNIGSNRTESIGSNDARTVGSNVTESVGGSMSLSVSSSQTEMIGSSVSRTVGSNVTEEVGGNISQTVGGNFQGEIAQNHNVTAGMNINLTGGMAVNITAGATGVNIVGPGGFISITEAGVAIMGTMVLINSGGSPTPATAASPASPESPSQPETPQSPTAPTAPFTADDQSKFTKLG